MKLEDEIKQKKFKSPEHRLALNILYTVNWLNHRMYQGFREIDLTPQQYNVLRILRGQHPNHCSQKDIRERMLDRMSDVSRIIDKLVKKQLVIRHQCPSDRRSVNLLISDKGLKLLKELDHIDDELIQNFQNLTPRQVQTLNDLLDKMRGND